MPATTKKKLSPAMSDAAVQAKTGKNWKEWFAILDRAGAKKMRHPEIAQYLHDKHAVPPWWTQMVTVNYERARGMRDVHEKPDGYSVSVSRTINTPLGKLYKSFADTKTRKTWLSEDGLVIRKATTNKTMRVTWHDGKSNLEVYFVPKSDKKSQVVVQHSKLPNAKASSTMKSYWTKALDRLRDSLEK